ncbi:outer membrane protein assembly factor BamD [Viridibacterium curvum]|uniref:Outer membrane protein assembly factor BamD n=1 Tax=Viridibacterium curvum TaxID=1101404 RepID=A0ABP9QXQ1_9RHOO
MFNFTLRSVPVVLALCLTLGLTACATNERLKGDTPQKLFDEAKELQTAGSWEQAIKGFEQLESTFPFGRHAQQAQLEIAYTYYRMQEYASTVAACDRFLKQYPNHAAADYALYLKGVATQIEEDRFFALFFERDLAGLDQAATREAFEVFKTLVTRFPDSIYAPESRERMEKISNALARGDLSVARYYYRRGAVLAAANRAKSVMTTHPDSPVVEEALAILMASYKQMGLDDLRRDAERVLRLNYPQSAWLSREYKAPS